MRIPTGVATLLIVGWPAAAASSPVGSPEWFLVGGAHDPTVFQALGGGRALVCNDRRCDVWDQAHGWTPTEAVVLPLNTLSHLRRRDGAVVAIDGARKIASEIWSPTTGHWTAAAALPEPLNDLQTAELADGRILAVGQWHRGLRAYVADAGLRAWSVLIDSPDGLTNPWVIPNASGLWLFAGQRVWRHAVGTEGWREIPVGAFLSGRFPWLKEWGDEVLVVLSEERKALLVGQDGRSRPTAALPSSGASMGLNPIATADGARMWIFTAGNDPFVWRRPDEAPIPFPWNPIDPAYKVIMLDDGHLLGVGTSGGVTELALDGKPPPGRPCDGLALYLAQTPPPTPAVSELALVSAGCRDQVRRGEAPALVAIARSWAADPGRVDYGRAFDCALQDPGALKVLPRWLEEKQGHARMVCYRSLATWPGVEAAWKPALASAVWKAYGSWSVDPAVIALAAAVPTPDIRERLVPTLRVAADRHAAGFDELRDQVCASDPAMSAARVQTCADLHSLHQAEWWRQEEVDRAKPASRVPRIIISTAVVAGAIGAAYVTRDGPASRGIATAAGAVGGAALGFTAVGVGILSHGWGSSSSHGGDEGGWLLVGVLGGGILGGVAAYAATAAPSSRAPATGVGLAIPYLFTVLLPFD